MNINIELPYEHSKKSCEIEVDEFSVENGITSKIVETSQSIGSAQSLR